MWLMMNLILTERDLVGPLGHNFKIIQFEQNFDILLLSPILRS
jgi:hypothetical protein